MTGGPVLLNGYAAKQCARRVHNEWDSTIIADTLPLPAQVQARFVEGRAFEASIRVELANALGGRCRIIGEDAGRVDAIALTVQAMDAGVEVIVGGWLPDDVVGGRTGRPDVLLRVSDAGVRPAYVAGDIKWHLSTKAAVRGTWTYSTLGSPQTLAYAPGRAARTSDRFDDFIQLAHYARMLQACGRAPDGGTVRGFIIGTDPGPSAGVGHVLTWLDLDAALFTSFSRSSGSRRRSALERYDHEHGFRVRVASRARERVGAPDDPEPLVVPIVIDECDVCPWRQFCRDLIGPQAASAFLEAGRLDVREWLTLAKDGVLTAEDLAALDLDDSQWWAEYLPQVAHQANARDRLTLAVTRTRMALSGQRLARTTTGPFHVPRADVEIDVDIEWDTDNRVFLWGALLTDARNPAGAYIDFTDLDRLDEAGERALGWEFLRWLRSQVASARDAGLTVAVFHYSHPEMSHLVRVFGETEVADVRPLYVDLLPIMRANFVGVAGLSIKEVAREFGFHWRDADPGGLQAQAWLAEARAADAVTRSALRTRLLEYNEDDVRATAALRNGLSLIDS